MTTLTAIANAIRDILIDLEDIDLATLDGYLPAVETQKVALLIPPMGLRGSVGAPVGHKTRLVHRIPLEFWVRVDNGDLAACLRRAREVCLNAAAELQANLTLSGTVTHLGDGDTPPFEWSVDDEMINTGKATFVRANLAVTVTVWVVLTA